MPLSHVTKNMNIFQKCEARGIVFPISFLKSTSAMPDYRIVPSCDSLMHRMGTLVGFQIDGYFFASI